MSRIDSLLEESPDLVRAADSLGNNALHWTALTRQLDLIDCFHELGADIDARRADGRTPLQVALDGDYWYRSRDLPQDAIDDPWVVVDHLLARGAQCDLTMACARGDLERVGEILEREPAAVGRLSPARCSPLYSAARFGHEQMVRRLLDCGADPNLPEDLAPRGRALHAAAAGNHLGTARMLLEAGADANAEVDSSGDCLFVAEFNHPKHCKPMQSLLRQYGASSSPSSSDGDMKEALKSGYNAAGDWLFMTGLLRSEDAELHDLFIERHADVVPQLVAGDVWGGDIPTRELLDKLLDRGLDPNRPNWIGRTFLHVAAEKGSVEIAEALIEAGADLEAVELEYGGTPLAAAARKGQKKMVGYLLEKGADPDAPSESPWGTARTWAQRQQDEEVIGLFSSN